MDRVCVFAMVILCCTVGSADESTNSEPYSRRGFKLGMTLSEFRKVDYPDPTDHPNAQLYLSTDAMVKKDYDFSGIMPGELDEKLGIVKAQFYWQDSGPLHDHYPASIDIGGHQGPYTGYTTFMFISADNETEPKLFMMVTTTNSSRYDELKRLYVSSLKQEPRIETHSIQNGLGATFQNETAAFENKTCTLTISRYGDSLKLLKITHALKSHLAIFEQRMKVIDNERAKQL